jgi:hypothetical protein
MNAIPSIKSGVYFAAVQGEGVVMDLVADRYFGLTGLSTRIWECLKQNLSVEQIVEVIAEAEAIESSDARDLIIRHLEAWREAKLIAPQTDPPTTLPRPKPSGIPAQVELDQARLETVRLSLSGTFLLIGASQWNHFALKRRGLAWTLKRIQDISVPVFDPAHFYPVAYRIVRAYTFLRRPFKQGQHDCLSRSLALAATLRKLGVDAEFCLGVRKFPFSAHAWVEARGVALNEPKGRLRKFTMLARF